MYRKFEEDNLVMNKTNSYGHSKQKEVAVIEARWEETLKPRSFSSYLK